MTSAEAFGAENVRAFDDAGERRIGVEEVDEVIRGERFAEGEEEADKAHMLQAAEPGPGRIFGRRSGQAQGFGQGNRQQHPVKGFGPLPGLDFEGAARRSDRADRNAEPEAGPRIPKGFFGGPENRRVTAADGAHPLPAAGPPAGPEETLDGRVHERGGRLFPGVAELAPKERIPKIFRHRPAEAAVKPFPGDRLVRSAGRRGQGDPQDSPA
ncbi:MAG: hypothetical protein BWX98_02252 [Candidatus Aminicenantes bacterium ADurb.Bin147]|nr:MAG: hypothetical protein BWX98_02252 [Candidatus Aminicenantes bacterium ADurb.Bin147]